MAGRCRNSGESRNLLKSNLSDALGRYRSAIGQSAQIASIEYRSDKVVAKGAKRALEVAKTHYENPHPEPSRNFLPPKLRGAHLAFNDIVISADNFTRHESVIGNSLTLIFLVRQLQCPRE